MNSVMDAVSRLASVASDHPDLATPLNQLIDGLLASKRRPPTPMPGVNGNGNGRISKGFANAIQAHLNFSAKPKPKPKPADDCECVKPGLTVFDAAKLVGFDHQTVAKWCRMGRIRASKEWRKDRRGGRVRSWSIEPREVSRVLAAGLLNIDLGRNAYPS